MCYAEKSWCKLVIKNHGSTFPSTPVTQNTPITPTAMKKSHFWSVLCAMVEHTIPWYLIPTT